MEQMKTSVLNKNASSTRIVHAHVMGLGDVLARVQ